MKVEIDPLFNDSRDWNLQMWEDGRLNNYYYLTNADFYNFKLDSF